MAAYGGLNREFMQAAGKAPFLTKEHERRLAESWITHQDQRAMQVLVEAHMRLVIAIAQKFRHYGLSASDLIQEGHVGLLEAASRFDLAKDVRFSTYATWWIRASIQDFVLKNWSIVRGGTSAGQKALFFNLRKLRAKLQREGKVFLADIHQSIADALGVSTADVMAMDARLGQSDMSLNAPVGDGEGVAEFQDFLVDEAHDHGVEVSALLDGEKRRNWIAGALGTLNARELRIITQRKMSDDERTLDEIGHDLGISKERVRQIETRALEKLKAALLRQQPDRAAFV